MKKNKGKQIFGYIITFIIFTLFLLSMYIWDSSRLGEGNVFSIKINETEDSFTAKYIKRIDGDAYVYDGPLITDELVESIMDIAGVKEACLGTKVSVLMKYINFPGEGVAQWNYELEKREAAKGYGASYQSGYSMIDEDKYNVLRGYNDTALIDYFRTGAMELVDGNHITDEDEHKVLVSDELAELNGLSVGDTFTTEMKLYDSLQRGIGSTVMEIELEIAGIFHVNEEQNLEGYPLKEDIAVNYMFVNNKTVREYDQMYRHLFILDEVPVYTSAEFFVRNPLRLNGIMNKAEKLADSTYYKVSSSVEIDKDLEDAYQRTNKASFILAGWFGITGVILLVMLFRKRLLGKNSFGVLGICLILATGAAFAGTEAVGNLMFKVSGVEEVVDAGEVDLMKIPETVKGRREYFSQLELKCNVVEETSFQRDISVLTIVGGEVALVLMCGLAFILGKRK